MGRLSEIAHEIEGLATAGAVEQQALDFRFYPDGFENSALPCIVRDATSGGDPHIVCVLSRVHDASALRDLCFLANDQTAERAAAKAVQ